MMMMAKAKKCAVAVIRSRRGSFSKQLKRNILYQYLFFLSSLLLTSVHLQIVEGEMKWMSS